MIYRFYYNPKTNHKCTLFYSGDTYRDAVGRFMAERDDGVTLKFGRLDEGNEFLLKQGYLLSSTSRCLMQRDGKPKQFRGLKKDKIV